MGRNDGKESQAEKGPMLTKIKAKEGKIMKNPTGTKATYNRVVQTHSSDVQMNLNTCAHMLLPKHSLTNSITRTSHKHTQNQQKKLHQLCRTHAFTSHYVRIAHIGAYARYRCRNYQIFETTPTMWVDICASPSYHVFFVWLKREKDKESRKEEKKTNVCSLWTARVVTQSKAALSWKLTFSFLSTSTKSELTWTKGSVLSTVAVLIVIYINIRSCLHFLCSPNFSVKCIELL